MNSLERILLILWLSILFIATVFIVVGEAHAQSGCPASASAETAVVEVLQSTELVGAIRENQIPNPQAVNEYYQTQVMIDYQGQRVLLFVPCVDDAVRVVNLTTGREWFWTYASTDGSRIVTKTELVDITFLFAPYSPGQYLIEVSLIDERPKYHSASPIVLYQVAGQPPIEASASGTPQSPSSDGISAFGSDGQPTTTPAVSPTLTLAASQTLTSTPTLVVIASASQSEAGRGQAEEPPITSPTNLWPPSPLALAGLAAGLVLAALAAKTLASGRTWVVEELEEFQDGKRVNRRVLADIGKPVITLGSTGDILVPGDQIPPHIARLRKVKEKNEQYTVIEFLNPDDGQVFDQRSLFHGDEFYISNTRFVYLNYAEEEPILPIELEEDFDV